MRAAIAGVVGRQHALLRHDQPGRAVPGAPAALAVDEGPGRSAVGVVAAARPRIERWSLRRRYRGGGRPLLTGRDAGEWEDRLMRFTADWRPLLAVSISNSTTSSVLSVRKPAFLTALICTKTSLSPAPGPMKPYPLMGSNPFTFPLGIVRIAKG